MHGCFPGPPCFQHFTPFVSQTAFYATQVGTPGRVYDMLRRRNLRADHIKMFVLDEADEMLSRGFKDQIYDIFQLLPPKLQVYMRICADFVTAGVLRSRCIQESMQQLDISH